MRQMFSVLLLICCCAAASANEIDERKVLAARLVEGMGVKSTATPGSADACNPSAAMLTKKIADAYRKRPGDFFGISPQSAYWPEVEQAWRDFYAEQCAGGPDEAALDIFANIYATRLSVAELREALAFQASAAGRAIKAANAQVCEELTDAANKRSDVKATKANAKFHTAMRLLKLRYESDPK